MISQIYLQQQKDFGYALWHISLVHIHQEGIFCITKYVSLCETINNVLFFLLEKINLSTKFTLAKSMNKLLFSCTNDSIIIILITSRFLNQVCFLSPGIYKNKITHLKFYYFHCGFTFEYDNVHIEGFRRRKGSEKCWN